ncbi:TfoX/Sxy family protein [Maribacter sp. SA7]|uniref:TfoX N-terminal domain-containing protein n=1 Tax=Maribacter aquivivus TaxID=228958 RepID=A0A1M6MCR6_9FLAO|nr:MULTISPECIES: TfoX/Sxy family protein [Maribacter]MDF4202190.1 TfoX/Sxy family protein [Maribacter zhoushanensis]SHJ81217.1 TfoX N-terminal domain-containing protein [Maribacter aquivivus]
MAYSEYLADRVRPRLKGKGHLEEKKMMGGLTFMVNGKMCIGIMFDKKSEEDKLMVRVGKLNYEELLNKPGSRPMDFTGKPIRGFLFVGPDGFDTEDDLDFWVENALEFNRLLNQ